MVYFSHTTHINHYTCNNSCLTLSPYSDNQVFKGRQMSNDISLSTGNDKTAKNAQVTPVCHTHLSTIDMNISKLAQ